MVEGNADRPGPDVVLEVATALAERMGGAAPLAMICLDPQVLEYGRELIDKKESGRISLCQTLEDIFQGQGRDCKLRIEAGDGSQPFPMVRLVRDDAGGGIPGELVWDATGAPTDKASDVGLTRTKRKLAAPCPSARKSQVSLNIYDLGSSGQMSFVNSVLKPFDSGAFHCGIEVYGLEWSYSDIRDVKVDRARTGIFSSWPKHSPGHRFVETVDMGFTTKTEAFDCGVDDIGELVEGCDFR
ncbi:Hypothetical protein SCF082_LOCUS52575 [Durusdinium trenchii]|uniref:PPPDE domain-containing protein n=1 Tax=Durusdinium trenchii TaxID=1381693 RepID=A0ABP0SM74_9DINO